MRYSKNHYVKKIIICDEKECSFNYTHWSFMLQNRGLSRLILKNTLGLCAILSCVYFPFRRSPFIPGTTKHRNISMTQRTFSSSINQVF